MIKSPANRNELLAVFSQVAEGFTATGNRVTQYEARISPLLAALTDTLQRDPWANSALRRDHPFLQFVEDHTARLREMLRLQVGEMLSYQRKNRFRLKFDDALMVYVYGKVKAGKSSFGNYIAWGHPCPDAALKSQLELKPAFFCEVDSGKTENMSAEKMVHQQHFSVGVSETTSAIQGFTLPGLTWIDSPGIHSVTAENGRLAQEYSDAADLIIYLTSSSSPGRKSDLEVMREVVEKNKPMMVLIPASDIIDEDEDDDGNPVSQLIMKSDSDRADQENYVSESLSALVDSHKAGVTVQSISVEYARQGAETERNARWQESGLKTFAETVTRITQSDGLRMKQRTPLINHKNVCDYLTRSGDEIIALLDEVAAGLDDAAQKLHQEYERLCLELEQRLQPKIERLIDRYAMDNRQYSSHCSRVWEEEIATSKAALLTQVQQGFDQLTLNLNQLDVIDEAIPGFEKRVERIAFHSRLGENVGKAGGAAVGTAIGALMGSIVPGIGTAIGATVGGLLGGMFGGYGGGKIGENFNSTEYEDIEVGDNRVEVALRTRNMFSKRAERELGAVTVMLENASYGDIKAWLTEIHTALTALQLELRSQHLDLKKELLNNELT